MNERKNKGDAVDQPRRLVLKGLAGAMGAAAVGVPILSGMSFSAVAQGAKAPIGNYPAGVSGNTVVAGLTVDLTGPYSAQGEEERNGYELAAEQLNSGAAQIRRIVPGILAHPY